MLIKFTTRALCIHTVSRLGLANGLRSQVQVSTTVQRLSARTARLFDDRCSAPTVAGDVVH